MGEVVFVRVLALAVAVNLISIVSAECPSGWFGTNCQYQCHCADSSPCDQVDGSCGSGCHRDWFGPTCQYKSIELKSYNYPNLVDKNDETCLNVGSTSYINLQTPIPLTWIRLVFGNTEHRNPTTLYYYLEGETTPHKVHQTLSRATVNEKTLDIVCPTSNSVKTIVIHFPSNTSLCSVYVSGGRNLALGQFTEQSSQFFEGNGKNYWLSSNAVDGTIISDSEDAAKSTCTHTRDNKTEGWWKVTLSTPGFISSILIYNRENCCEERLKGFRLKASPDIGAAGKTRAYGPNETVSSTYEWVPSPQIEFPVKQVLVEKGRTSKFLTLCEVLVFGETNCPTRTFGLNCQGYCNCVSNENCFVHSGGCPSGCAPGYTGENCSVCERGRYGADCTERCGNCKSGSVCSNINGACPHGCEPRFTGLNCKERCSANCKDGLCEMTSGKCSYGCVPGYIGDKCDAPCLSGWYGDGCKKTCGNCVATNTRGSICNNTNGACSHGCKPGYTGLTCKQECSTNCNYGSCEMTTEKCSYGCVPGYTGDKCDSPCLSGWYGDGCKKTCDNCVTKGSICNNTNGTCFHGCKPGYHGDKCENECNSGYYGEECKTPCSEHCAGESNSCNHVNGTCELGCDPGYQGTLCTQECDSGYYGIECKTPCSEHCAGESNSCNHVTGICKQNCELGYQQPLCTQKCDSGYYGEGCKTPCSEHCAGESNSCNHATGICELGCDSGYHRPWCTRECVDFTWGKDCAQNCSSKCQNNTCHHVKGTCGACVPGYWGDFCEQVCNATTYGTNCTETCDNNCLSGLCDHVTGKCHACPTGRTGEFCQEAKQLENSSFGDAVKDFHMWIILTIVAVLLFVVSFAVIILYRRRSQRKTVARAVAPNHEENGVELDHIHESPVISDDPLPSTSAGTGSNKRNIFSRVQLSLNLSLGGTFFGNDCDSNESTAGASGVNADASQTGNTAIPVKELKNYILKHAADSHLEEEFLSVPKTSGSPQTAAGLPENAKKNRYKNIIPYDATRVQLETIAGKKNSDYINASYIKDHMGNRAFIASQGPTDAILDDFVRMLWEQRVEKVVMLTNLTEEGKKKCCMYWPQDGEKQFGGVSVRLLTTHVFAEYTIRNLCLAKRGQASRHLTQFHFTAWPDQSVPESPWGLVDLYQRVTAEEDNGPVLVHCSAGVGRTGTFIGLCNLLQEAEATGTMDFRSTLWKLRQDRMHAIQTLEQYSYLHRVALVGYMVAGTTIKEADMNCRLFSLESEKGGTKSTRNYSQEYQALVEVCDATTSHQADYLSEEQRKPVYQNLRDSRDRLSNILPKPSFRVKLVAEISREDTYINAVFVPNLTKNRQDILTQLPLPSTVTDFWRLVHQCDVGLIVAFDTDLKDGDETIGDFLPKSETEAFENDRFLVKANTRTERRLATEYSLSVQHKVLPDSDTAITQTKSVTLVLCKTIPIDPSSVFELLEQIEACKPMNRRRTVYMCRNGADKCGLMCIQSMLLERMRLDQCLTVPLVVGKIKAIRPQVIPTVEHYKCLYRVLKLAHDSQNEYGNIGALAGASST